MYIKLVFLISILMFLHGDINAQFNNTQGEKSIVVASNYPQSKKKKKKDIASNYKKDSDGDGIPDDEDDCIDMAGPAATKGCPDDDGDGVPNHLDECPDTPGLIQFKGCPDTDGDGIPDNKDVCPYEKGPASNNGCPILDKGKTVATVVEDSVYRFNDEDMQLQRYEKYLYELQQFNASQVAAKNNYEHKNYSNNTTYTDNEPAEPAITEPKTVAEPNVVKEVKCTAVINGKSIPELEAMLEDIKFVEGRILFLDEQKCFNALNKLVIYCQTSIRYKKLVFICHSTDGSHNFSNSQLSRNRNQTLKKYLTKSNDLTNGLALEKLEFKIMENLKASTSSNSVHLEIIPY